MKNEHRTRVQTARTAVIKGQQANGCIESNAHVCVCICICTYIYMYTYGGSTWVEEERERREDQFFPPSLGNF